MAGPVEYRRHDSASPGGGLPSAASPSAAYGPVAERVRRVHRLKRARRVHRLKWAGLALCVLLLAGPYTDGSADTPLPRGSAPVGHLALGERALWTEQELAMDAVQAVHLVAGHALVVGGTDNVARFTVADPRTGKPRWVRDALAAVQPGVLLDFAGTADSRRRPVVVGAGEDAVVVLPYVTDGVTNESPRDRRRGVVALALGDGEVRWKRELTGPDGQVSPTVAADHRALVAVRDSPRSKPTTYALDGRDGTTLWEHPAWVYAIADDTALGTSDVPKEWRSTHPSDTADDPDPAAPDSQALALSVRDGRPKWSSGAGDQRSELTYARTEVLAALGPYAVLRAWQGPPPVVQDTGRPPPDPSVTVVVDAATGAPTYTRDIDVSHCHSDERLLVCDGGVGGEILTIDVRGDGKAFSLADTAPHDPPLKPAQVDAVSGSRIHLSGVDTRASSEPRRAVAVDRAGNTRADDLPGPTLAVSASYAAFQRLDDDDELTGLAMYAVDRGESATTDPPRKAAPKVPALRLAERSDWGLVTDEEARQDSDAPERKLELSAVHDTELIGDTVLVSGNDTEYQDAAYVAVDRASGKVRWTVGGDRGLGEGRHLTTSGGHRLDRTRQLLLLTYESHRDEGERGVAALSLKDGEVVWTKRVPGPPGGPDTQVTTTLTGLDGSSFAVTTRERQHPWDRSRTKVTLVESRVYDLTDRDQRQVIDGLHARGLVDGVLVGDRAAPNGGTDGDTGAVGVDVASGKELWRVGANRTGVTTAVPDPRVAVVRHESDSTLVDPATGDPLATSRARLTDCAGQGTPLLGCTAGTGQAPYPVTIDLTTATRPVVRELPRLGHRRNIRAFGSWLFTTENSGGPETAHHAQMTDARGRELGEPLAGLPVAMDKRHVLLLEPSTRLTRGDRLTLHARK